MELNQYELGKKLYRDWRFMEEIHKSYQAIREMGKENLDLKELERGFVEERCISLQKEKDEDDIEAFYGALDEIGFSYWA